MRQLVLALAALPMLAADNDPLLGLLKVRRIYIDKLGGGETAQHLRDMMISSLQRSGAFVITENEQRADAFLRGSAEDLIFTDTHQTSESLNARAAFTSGAERESSTRYNRGPSASVGVGESESSRIAERKHEAIASVRLVNKEGDVIWSTTQESLGAKFRGASADVVGKVTQQLTDDFSRARRLGADGQRTSLR